MEIKFYLKGGGIVITFENGIIVLIPIAAISISIAILLIIYLFFVRG